MILYYIIIYIHIHIYIHHIYIYIYLIYIYIYIIFIYIIFMYTYKHASGIWINVIIKKNILGHKSIKNEIFESILEV